MARFATPSSISRLGLNLRAETSRTAGFARELLGVVPSIVALAVTAVILGFIIGLAAIVLPPTGAFGIVGLVGLVLLWVMPDLAVLPEKTLRVTFAVFLFCMVCIPNYYALQLTAALPWISIHVWP